MTDNEMRERLTRLETKFEATAKEVEEMSKTVTELRDLLVQAKGARWLLLAAAGLMGAVSGKITAVASWMGGMPK